MTVRVATLLLWGTVLLSGPPPAAGQENPGGEPQLGAIAQRIAELWARGDLDGLTSLLEPGGVQVQIPGGVGGSLAPRKARAVLGEILEAHGEGRIRVTRTSPSEGTPARGFAELRWSAVARGTSQVLRYTLFVGLVHGSEGWRVYEIRVMK